MNREELLEHICPSVNMYMCCREISDINCEECKIEMNTYLDEYDKHVIAEYEAKHSNLADIIREIHDNVSKQMYNKAVDDFVHKCEERCGFYTLGNAILTRKDILIVAKQLKEHEK